MSLQALGPRMCRKIARNVERPIKRAVGSGGYDFGFVTYDHEHGAWNKRTGQWRLLTEPITHWTSCRWLFDDEYARGARLAEQRAYEQQAGLAMAIGGPITVRTPGFPRDLCGDTATMHALDLVCQRPTEEHQDKPHWCGSEQWMYVVTDHGRTPIDPRNIEPHRQERYL